MGEAFETFTVVTRQPEMQAARQTVVRQKSAKRVLATAPFAVGVAAMKLLSEEELRGIKLRLKL